MTPIVARRAAALGALGLLLAAPAHAEVPLAFSHHGRLLDEADQPINATVDLTVRFYYRNLDPAGSGSSLVWEHKYTGVQVHGGAYSLLIGDTDAGPALDPDDWDGAEQRWLAIAVNDDPEMSPRLRVGSVPFALRAGDADTVAGSGPSDFAAAGHTHAIGEVTGVSATTAWTGTVPWERVTGAGAATEWPGTAAWERITGAGATTEWPGTAAWGRVDGKPPTYPPDPHGHVAADVTDFTAATATALAGATVPGSLTLSGNLKTGYSSALTGGLPTEFVKFGDGSAQSVTIGAGGNVAIQVDSNNNETGAAFVVRTNGTVVNDGTELMRVQDNGNVGIGTAAPAGRLTVVGGPPGVLINDGNLQIQAGTGANYGDWTINAGGGSREFSIFNQLANKHAIFIIGGSDAQNANNGNVGIGTTAPATKLDVNGTVRATDFSSNTPWIDMLIPSTGGWSATSAAPKCRVVNGWIEFRGGYSISLSAGWPATTALLLPAACRPQTTRYTEMPCHAASSPRNAVCNNDFQSNGNVGVHTDFAIIQLRFEGVRIWSGPD